MSTNNTIVLVEDDAFLTKICSSQLVEEGYEVKHAATGTEAVQLIFNDTPALVLMDIIIPGLNGFDVIEKMRKDKSTQDIDVIILSNLGQEEDVQRGLELGAVEYYTKAHTELSTVVGRIKELLAA